MTVILLEVTLAWISRLDDTQEQGNSDVADKPPNNRDTSRSPPPHAGAEEDGSALMAMAKILPRPQGTHTPVQLCVLLLSVISNLARWTNCFADLLFWTKAQYSSVFL